MRKTIVSFVLAASLAVAPTVARAENPGNDILFSAVAAVGNLFYTPAKVAVAVLALPLGAAAGLLNGGDTRAAYAFWVPAVGGRYFLTSDEMNGRTPFEFFGSDYTDKPSTYERAAHSCAAYDAKYVK